MGEVRSTHGTYENAYKFVLGTPEGKFHWKTQA